MELATMTQLLQVVGLEERVQMDSVGLARELVPQMNVAHLPDSGTCFFLGLNYRFVPLRTACLVKRWFKPTVVLDLA
jgi:hypothetical protein